MKLKYIYLLGLLCLLSWSNVLAKSSIEGGTRTSTGSVHKTLPVAAIKGDKPENNVLNSCQSCIGAGGTQVLGNGKVLACFFQQPNKPSLFVYRRQVNGALRYQVGYKDINGNTQLDSHTYSELPRIEVRSNCSTSATRFIGEDYPLLFQDLHGDDPYYCSSFSVGGTSGHQTYSCNTCKPDTERLVLDLTATSLAFGIAAAGATVIAGVASLPAAAVVLTASGAAIVVGTGTIAAGATSAAAVLSGLAGTIISQNCNDVSLTGRQTKFYQNMGKKSSAIVAGIQPNPAQALSTLNLHLPETTELTVEIFDQQGRHRKTIVMGQRFAEGLNKIPLQVQDLATGTYIVKVTGSQGLKLTQRLVKK